MIFNDEGRASKYLAQIGYYRLSGYWYPFRNSEIGLLKNGKAGNIIHDDFREGTSFDAVLRLYIFDKKLRLLFLDALERIEISLRTAVALTMGEIDPWSYRNSNYLDRNFCRKVNANFDSTKFEVFIDKCESSYQKSRETFVEHFRANYNQPLPVWAAVELWEFGTLSMFIEGMRFSEKTKASEIFSISQPNLFPSWIRTMAFVRNVCAHHNRLWNRPIIAQPKTPAAGTIPLLEHLIGDNYALERLYAAAAITRYFLLQINPSSNWNYRFIEVIDQFPEGPGIAISHAGFPENWQELDLWK